MELTKFLFSNIKFGLDNSVNDKVKHGDHEDCVFIKPDVDKRKKNLDENVCSRNNMAIKSKDKSSSQKRPYSLHDLHA
jgi:hypothetical protein